MTHCNGMKCFLFDGCPGRTGVCYSCGPDDDGCPVYRWFKEKVSKEQPQWISVEDRLPDKQPCEYLVVNANNVETAICLDNRWITPRRVIKITHWMPLPTPPEVKQDD